MRDVRFIIIIICVLASNTLSAQSSLPDSIGVKAFQKGDSITLQMTAYQIETQLAFLMQGVNVTIVQPDTLMMSFPSAAMVRKKVKRHPNEVKAVLEKQRKQQSGQDSINHVVRPDVQPLVAALNDTTATIYYQNGRFPTREFMINVDRENAIMDFLLKLNGSLISSTGGLIELYVFSAPFGNSDKTEFVGKKLSNENSPHPNGLGEGIRKEDVSKRTFKKHVIVKINDAYEE